MPYIKQTERDHLDNSINVVAYRIECLFLDKDKKLCSLLGILNYSITKLIQVVWSRCELLPYHYSNIAMITGVLENVKQEFYRRVAAPYEDKKAKENGDVF